MPALLLGLREAERKPEAERETVRFVTHDIDESVFMGSRGVVTSARPGRIKLDREATLPHPRHSSVKTSPAFADLEDELTEAVRSEVGSARRQDAMAALAQATSSP